MTFSTKSSGKDFSVRVDRDHERDRRHENDLDLSKLNNLVLSDSRKKLKNFAIIRSIIDMICGQEMSEKMKERHIENLNLLYGRWPNLNAKGLNVDMNIEGYGNIKYGRTKVNHTSRIDKIGQGVLSSLMNQNNKPVVVDHCRSAAKYKKDAQIGIIHQRLADLYFNPSLQEAKNRVMAQYGGEIPPDQSQSANEQVQAIANELMGPEIDKAMKRSKVPTEKLMKKLLEISSVKSDLNYELEKGANHVIANGMEFYRRRFGYNKVYMESIPTFNSAWCLSNNSEFVEDGLWFKYDRWLTPVELVTEYFDKFGNKELKELERMMEPIPMSHFDNGLADVTLNHTNPNALSFEIEVDTYGRVNEAGEFEKSYPIQEDGKIWANSVFEGLMNSYVNDKRGIKVTYCTWRWLKKAKKVHRKKLVGTEERIVELIRGENYKFNRSRGDLKIENTAVPETYEGTICGDMYFDMGPVRGQVECVGDIDKPKLGVYGAVYNTLCGAIKNSSLVDHMKPSQFRITVLHDVLMDSIVNDIGTALVVDEQSIAMKKGGPQAFFNMLYKFKTIVRNSNNRNSNNQDIYAINLGSNANHQSYIQLINFYENQLIEAGSTTQADFSSLGQYANQANVNASLANADRRKYRLFSMSRRVRERVYNAMMWGAFYSYKDNDEIKDCYLDDELRVHYEENFDEIAGSPVRAEINDTPDKKANLEVLRQYVLNYINQGGKISEIAGLVGADTMGELMDIAEDAERATALEQQKMQKAQIDGQNQAIQKKIEADIEIENRKDLRADKDNEVKLKSAYLRSLFMANGQDVDEDNQADFLTNNREQRDLDHKHRLLTHEEKKEELAIKRGASKS